MRSWRRWLAGGATCLVLGCAGPTPTSDRESASSGRDLQTGLIAERWRVPRNAGLVEEIFATAVAENPAIDETGVATMRRDGFRCAIGRRDVIERMLRDRTDDGLAGRTWHGEATTWRSLIGRRTQGGTVLLVDGRARRLPESVVSIEIRGWSLPTPEDAAVHMQLVPILTTSVGPRIGTAPSRPGRLRGTPLATTLESTLGVDQCLVLTSVAGLQAPETSVSEDTTDEASSDASISEGDGFGPGPTGSLPPTIAAWLLEDARTDTESLIVIYGRPHAGTRTPAPPSQ